MSAPLPAAARVLVGAALAEFVLLRLFLRLGPALPSGETLLPLYQLVETAGLVALNVALLAAAVVLGGWVWQALAGRFAERALGLSLLGALLANLGLGVLLMSDWTALVVGTRSSVTLLAIVGLGWCAAVRQPGGLVAVPLAIAMVASLAAGLAEQAGGVGPGSSALFVVAELAAVSGALVLPLVSRARPRRGEAALGLVLAALLLGFALVRPWTLSTLTMWTVAFSGSLPAPLYALGLGSLVMSLLTLRRGNPRLAAGVLLVVLAGLKLDFNYFSLLGLAGFAILAVQPVRRVVSLPEVEIAGSPA